jgi:peptidyl-tRNA hydrolase
MMQEVCQVGPTASQQLPGVLDALSQGSTGSAAKVVIDVNSSAQLLQYQQQAQQQGQQQVYYTLQPGLQ